MSRARGANLIAALAFESVYGRPETSGYIKVPIAGSISLGDTQALVESDLLGFGRDPQAPSLDVVNNRGTASVPVDLRIFGYWLRLFMGAPVTTQGRAAAGSYVFTAQPAADAVLTVNGTTLTFVADTPGAGEARIGATLAETLANAVLALNASTDNNVDDARYALNDDGDTILITHKVIGTAGNTFTLAAGADPASHATASGATLLNGSATGPYNHVFTPGALNLPSIDIELGFPDVPSFAMNYGIGGDTMEIALQRSGLLNASLGLIAQGEKPRTTTTAAGTPTELTIERFSQFTGQIVRSGVPLGDVASGTFRFANGLDPVEVIRRDGRIAGVDAGMMAVTGRASIRYKDNVLKGLASAGTPISLQYGWEIAADRKLTFDIPRVFLPKPRDEVTGPGGIMADYDWQAAKHPTLGRTMTATLVNDVESYA